VQFTTQRPRSHVVDSSNPQAITALQSFPHCESRYTDAADIWFTARLNDGPSWHGSSQHPQCTRTQSSGTVHASFGSTPVSATGVSALAAASSVGCAPLAGTV
jgi:hypothetical protein